MRIISTRQQFIADHSSTNYLSAEHPTVASIYENLRARISDENQLRAVGDQLPIPNISSLYRRIAALDPYEGSRRAYLGVFCAFIICMTTTLCGFYLVLKGFSTAGTVFTGMGLVGLAGTFIYGTRSQREERLRRDAANQAIAHMQ
jgi:hypothetical protein